MAAPLQVSESSNAASATTIGVAQGSNPTPGGTNVVWVRGPGGATVTGVADTLGHTYTARGSVIEAGTTQVLYQFTAPITSTGANTVTATYGAASSNRGIYVLEGAGAHDASNTGTDTGNNPTTAVAATNTAQPATVYMLCNDVQGGTAGVGTGFTDVGTGWATVGLNCRVQYKDVTTVASQSGNFANAGFDRTNTGLVILLPLAAPVITAQPVGAVVKVGGTASFSVTATGGTLTYQWQSQQGGAWSNVPGASSSSYTTPTLAAADSAGYRCQVTDAGGTTDTAAASLTVALPGKSGRFEGRSGRLVGLEWYRPLQGKALSGIAQSEFFDGAAGGATAAGVTFTAASTLIAGAAAASSNAAGQTLVATASLLAGSASASTNATAAGVTLTATSSMIAGAAAASSLAAGQTLTAVASLVAGTPAATSLAAGQVLTAASSVIAGSPAASSLAAGQVLAVAASLLAGSASAGSSATAAGQTFTAASALIAGVPAASSLAAGQVLTASASLIPGGASAGAGASAAGVLLTVASTLNAAAPAASSLAAGQVLGAAASLIVGAASGSNSAAGVTRVVAASLLAGGVAADSQALAALLTAAASLVSGVATGNVSAPVQGAARSQKIGVTLTRPQQTTLTRPRQSTLRRN